MTTRQLACAAVTIGFLMGALAPAALAQQALDRLDQPAR